MHDDAYKALSQKVLNNFKQHKDVIINTFGLSYVDYQKKLGGNSRYVAKLKQLYDKLSEFLCNLTKVSYNSYM